MVLAELRPNLSTFRPNNMDPLNFTYGLSIIESNLTEKPNFL